MHSHDIPLHLFTTPLAQFVREAAAIYQKWRWQRTPPSVSKDRFHQFSFHLRRVKVPHLHVLRGSRFLIISVSFLVDGSITPIPGCRMPLGCRTKQRPRPPGNFMSWRVSETRFLTRCWVKRRFMKIYLWYITYTLKKDKESMYVWTYICKTYTHIICTSTWHRCIDIQSHKISTGFAPNWTSSISSPPKRNEHKTHTHKNTCSILQTWNM